LRNLSHSAAVELAGVSGGMTQMSE